MRELMMFLTRAGGVLRGARTAAKSRTMKVLLVAFVVGPAVLLILSAAGADILAIPVIAAVGFMLLFRWPLLTGLIAAAMTYLAGYPEAGVTVGAAALALVPVLRIVRAKREPEGGEGS